MLQLFDNKYPYTDFHELNLDWIISKLIQMDHKLTNFVNINTIKYADPIAWDISRQYEMNTVTIDPLTGIAYISTQPVPAGISIGNTDYWTEVFNLQQIIGYINENLTVHDNGTSPTLLGSVQEGDWVLWNNKLYVALADLIAGTALIVGTNIDEASVEDLTKSYTDAVDAKIGDLSTLLTTDKSSVVNAINEEFTTRASADAALDNKIGDLSTLLTTDKSSVVNAINEVFDTVDNIWTTEIYINVKDIDPSWGLVNLKGDDLTDDTAALQALMAYLPNLPRTTKYVLYFPSGVYLLSDTIDVPSLTALKGEGTLLTSFRTQITDRPLFSCAGYNSFSDLNIQNLNADNSNNSAINENGIQSEFTNIRIYNFKVGIRLTDASGTKTYQVYIESNVDHFYGFILTGRCVSSKFLKTVVVGNGVYTGIGWEYASGNYCMDLQFMLCETSILAYPIILRASTTALPGDILINSCVFDGCYSGCLVVNDMAQNGNIIFTNNWVNFGTLTGNHDVIDLNNVHNAIISHNRLSSLNAGGTAYLTGVNIDSCENITIDHNDFHSLKYGLVCNGCDYLSFDGNIMDNTSNAAGIALYNISNVKYATITNNKLHGDIKYTYDHLTYTTTDSIIKNNILEASTHVPYTEASCIIADNIDI